MQQVNTQHAACASGRHRFKPLCRSPYRPLLLVSGCPAFAWLPPNDGRVGQSVALRARRQQSFLFLLLSYFLLFGHMVTAVTMWPFSWFSGSIICINDWILIYYTIIISSFAFLWSHGHNCDRDRFLPKLVVYSGVLVVVQVRISCIQRRISCIQTCISCIQWRIFNQIN